jgi:hypothetical protein
MEPEAVAAVRDEELPQLRYEQTRESMAPETADGLVIVRVEDLDVVMNQGDEKAGWQRYSDACDRLRAALPEETTGHA